LRTFFQPERADNGRNKRKEVAMPTDSSQAPRPLPDRPNLRHLRDLVHRRFHELDFGATGYRRLSLHNATLLHVAAEYGNVEAARLLLDRGADINARATVDESGAVGQTPIFHAVAQFYDYGLPVAQLLVASGADLSLRAKLPGHYERPDETVECTPLGYALLFPGGPNESKSVQLLRARGAPE
jgi:ankyrin repeat protein